MKIYKTNINVSTSCLKRQHSFLQIQIVLAVAMGDQQELNMQSNPISRPQNPKEKKYTSKLTKVYERCAR